MGAGVSRAQPNLGTLVCQQCGANEKKRGTTQIYCYSCSRERARIRGRKWAKKNKPAPNHARVSANYAAKYDRMVVVGGEISKSERLGIFDTPKAIDYKWKTTIAVPYSLDASKNRMYCIGRQRRIFLRSSVRAYRKLVVDAVRAAVLSNPGLVKTNKVWISLFVQKTNHKSDAINVIDTLADAIKDAIGVDDRWFCLDRVDWQIVKGEDPMVFISIGQEDVGDARACSFCGRILSLGHFHKGPPTAGSRRECIDCRKPRRDLAGSLLLQAAGADRSSDSDD